jgi:hypothetical protein
MAFPTLARKRLFSLLISYFLSIISLISSVFKTKELIIPQAKVNYLQITDTNSAILFGA